MSVETTTTMPSLAVASDAADLETAWQSLVAQELTREFTQFGLDQEAVEDAAGAIGLDALIAAHFDVHEWHSKLSARLGVPGKPANQLDTYATWQKTNFLLAMKALKSEHAITDDWTENEREESLPPESALKFIKGSAELSDPEAFALRPDIPPKAAPAADAAAPPAPPADAPAPDAPAPAAPPADAPAPAADAPAATPAPAADAPPADAPAPPADAPAADAPAATPAPPADAPPADAPPADAPPADAPAPPAPAPPAPPADAPAQFGVTARYILWREYTKYPDRKREMPKGMVHNCGHKLNTSLCPDITKAVRKSELGYAPGFFTALKWSQEGKEGTPVDLEVGAVRQTYHHYHDTKFLCKGTYLKKDWGTLNKLLSQPTPAHIPLPADVKNMSRQDCEGVANKIRSQYSNLDLGYQDAVLLVHGYKTSVKSAMKRVAILARRVPLLHADVGMFSFGSNEALLEYHDDERRAQAAVQLLATTLQALATNLRKPHVDPVTVNKVTGEKQQQVPLRVHIVAHSLGCRLTFKALKYLKEQGIKLPLGHVVLASADIGVRKDGAADLEAAARYNCENITTYFSYGDWPLWASSLLTAHNDLRVGQYPFRFEGNYPFSVDTRCVSSGKGHSDLFDSPYARQDLHWVLQHGRRVETPFRKDQEYDVTECKCEGGEGRSRCKLNCDHVERFTITKGATGDCTAGNCDATGPCAAGEWLEGKLLGASEGPTYKFHLAILFTEGILLPAEYIKQAKVAVEAPGAAGAGGDEDANRTAQLKVAVTVQRHAAVALMGLLLSGLSGAEVVPPKEKTKEQGKTEEHGVDEELKSSSKRSSVPVAPDANKSDAGAGAGMGEAAGPPGAEGLAVALEAGEPTGPPGAGGPAKASITDEEKELKELKALVERSVAFVSGERSVAEYTESESLARYEGCPALDELGALQHASRVMVDELERLFHNEPAYTPPSSTA